MARAYASAIIKAPIETVWSLVRDFNGLPDWAALALGFGAIPVLVPLTAYYEVALLGVAFLALLRAEIGAVWCLLAALSWRAAPLFGKSDYDQLAASALSLAAVLFATLRARAAQQEPGAEIRIP